MRNINLYYIYMYICQHPAHIIPITHVFMTQISPLNINVGHDSPSGKITHVFVSYFCTFVWLELRKGYILCDRWFCAYSWSMQWRCSIITRLAGSWKRTKANKAKQKTFSFPLYTVTYINLGWWWWLWLMVALVDALIPALHHHNINRQGWHQISLYQLQLTFTTAEHQ